MTNGALYRNISNKSDMTRMTTDINSDISYSTSEITLIEVTNIKYQTQITGLNITNTGTPTNPTFVVYGKKTNTDEYIKIAPYSGEQDIYSGTDFDLPVPLIIPKNGSYKITFKCDTTNSATADIVVNKIEII